MYQRIIIFFLLFLSSNFSFGQDLNGIWRGTLTQEPGGCFPVYKVEVQITAKDNVLSGFCYHYSDITNYVKKNFEGIYNPQTKAIAISEKRVQTFHIPAECTPCIRYYSLFYNKEGNNESLSGEWGGVVLNSRTACAPGRIVLNRVVESEFSHIKEIRVDTGIIKLEFYDNGVIDGDTISVMLNNNVLVSHQRLALKPITVEIKVDLDHKEQEVTMVAENLGSIPPNTALLIVTAGKNRYKLYLSSNGQKNAQVRFIYDE
ncbi:MAG: hypothetical protein ABIN57_04575 [Chitinophagaceae bacterium]